MKIMNTMFRKPNSKLATYKEKGNFHDDAIRRYTITTEYNVENGRYENRRKQKYEVLDYIITPDRWKKSVKYVEADHHGRLSKKEADHFPLIAEIEIRLRAMKRKTRSTRGKDKFDIVKEEQRLQYNQRIREEMERLEQTEYKEEELQPRSSRAMLARGNEAMASKEDEGKGVLDWSEIMQTYTEDEKEEELMEYIKKIRDDYDFTEEEIREMDITWESMIKDKRSDMEAEETHQELIKERRMLEVNEQERVKKEGSREAEKKEEFTSEPSPKNMAPIPLSMIEQPYKRAKKTEQPKNITIPLSMIETGMIKKKEVNTVKAPKITGKEETGRNPWTGRISTEVHYMAEDDTEEDEPESEYEEITNDEGKNKLRLIIDLIDIRLGGPDDEEEYEKGVEVVTAEERDKLENKKAILNYILRLARDEEVSFKVGHQGINNVIVETEERYAISSLLPNNLGDKHCDGITDDRTYEEDDFPKYYCFNHEGRLTVIAREIFGRFMNNREYYQDGYKRNTDLERMMRPIGKEYTDGNKHRDVNFQKIINKSSELLPRLANTKRGKAITGDVVILVQQRREALKDRNFDKIKELTKEIKNLTTKNNRENMRNMVRKDMDTRNKALGLKRIMKGYKAKPYNLRDKEEKSIPFNKHAEHAATIWEKEIWKDKRTDKEKREFEDWAKNVKHNKVHSKKLNFDKPPFKIEELNAVLKKFKKRKAAGPDDEALELYQNLDQENRMRLLEIINDWWIHNEFPEDKLHSRIVFLFKKGKTSDVLNFRPIALTNATYKIFASLIQKRMAKTMDHIMHKTQYGFRKNKSTGDAIYLIRRLVEQGERSSKDFPSLKFITLDWEKAFDSVINEALYLALQRLGVDEHFIEVIKKLYSVKNYKVEMNGEESEYHNQETGIRQGCPLSPYLFYV